MQTCEACKCILPEDATLARRLFDKHGSISWGENVCSDCELTYYDILLVGTRRAVATIDYLTGLVR